MTITVKQDEIAQALALWLAKTKQVSEGSLLDIRFKLTNSHGDAVPILLYLEDPDPRFEAEVTDFGLPQQE
jgi:hypothetical protein